MRICDTGTVRWSNPDRGEIFRTRPDRPWGPPNLLYNGYQVFPGGRGGRGVALPTHPHLQQRLKKECSYTCTNPLGLHDLFSGEFDLFTFLKVSVFCKFYSSINLSSKPRSCKWYLLYVFYHCNCCTPHTSPTPYTCAFHLLPSSIGYKSYTSSSSYLLSLRPKHFSQHPFPVLMLQTKFHTHTQQQINLYFLTF